MGVAGGKEGPSEELAFPLRSQGRAGAAKLGSAPGPHLDPDLGLCFCPIIPLMDGQSF